MSLSRVDLAILAVAVFLIICWLFIRLNTNPGPWSSILSMISSASGIVSIPIAIIQIFLVFIPIPTDGRRSKLLALVRIILSLIPLRVAWGSQRKNKNHFFISHNSSDSDPANRIDEILKQEGWSTRTSVWEGKSISFIRHMTKAHKKARYVLTILSPEYINTLRDAKHPEWIAYFVQQNLTGKNGIVVIVPECQLPPELELNLSELELIDLRGLDELQARRTLLAGLPLMDSPTVDEPMATESDDVKVESAPNGSDNTKSIVQSIQAQGKSLFSKVSIFGKVPFYIQSKSFSGRNKFLGDLHQKFKDIELSTRRPIIAITGMSGMGKTQTAYEYAYRYSNSGYYRFVLWINASSGLEEQIDALDTVEKRLKGGEDERWLLILDECGSDNLASLMDKVEGIASQGGKCHILLTTQAQAMPVWISPVKLKKMETLEGASFLLRLVPNDQLDKAPPDVASEISKAMGGLPLAIELVGSYIVGIGWGLQHYLNEYRTRREILFQKHSQYDPNKTIATIWSLAFDSLEWSRQKSGSMAGQLLQLCAFFAPNPIPEEMIANAPIFVQVFQSPNGEETTTSAFNDAIAELHKFSLIERDPNAKTLSIHPLVQTVIKDGIYKPGGVSIGTQRLCAKRTVLAVSAAFSRIEFSNWQRGQMYLPHAQVCLEYIKQFSRTPRSSVESFVESKEVIQLLNAAGHYLKELAQYVDAEAFFEQAQRICEKLLDRKGSDKNDLDLAAYMNYRAELYHVRGMYADAKRLYERSYAFHERNAKQDNPDQAAVLNNLGRFYDNLGRYIDAESFYRKALDIRRYLWEQKPEDPNLIVHLVVVLNNIAWIYFKQNKFDFAETLYKDEMLDIFKKILGADHPIVQGHAETEQNWCYEQIYHGILEILKKTLGVDHLYTAQGRANLATFYATQGKCDEAEPLYQAALKTGRLLLGETHPQIATRVNNLAELYRVQGEYDQAMPYYEQALTTYKQKLGKEHLLVASVMNNYAVLLKSMGRSKDAEGYLSRAREVMDNVTKSLEQ